LVSGCHAAVALLRTQNVVGLAAIAPDARGWQGAGERGVKAMTEAEKA